MNLIERIHGDYVHRWRVNALARHLTELIPKCARVLDVGCGDGLVDHLTLQHRPDLTISGVDVLIRGHTHIAVMPFDGRNIPHGDGTFDIVMFIDVLHHTHDPIVLLREAARVARRSIIIKDHILEGFLAEPTLQFMDRTGNARHGVALPHNYWTRRRWESAFKMLALTPAVWETDLKLYPAMINFIFGRSLHFIARLDVTPSL